MTSAGHAGRSYFRTYRTQGRQDLKHALTQALEQVPQARLLFVSPGSVAPVYVGVEFGGNQRIGLLVYPFRATYNKIKNRPGDEHRLQIRYGNEASWTEGEHHLGRDIAGVETTLVLGVNPEAGYFVGLEPSLYSPLPMGISVEFKQAHVNAAMHTGWHVIERENMPGVRRATPRARDGLETVVIFRPDRLLHYVHLERRAERLRLDSPLRYKLAETLTHAGLDALDELGGQASRHDLEDAFSMSSTQILDLLSSANRLEVAVRGRVAEWHLERLLRETPGVASVTPLDLDGQPDFKIVLTSGRVLRIECKNCSPRTLADGTMRVEVQKTRASKSDPSSRFYDVDHFDAVAACLFPVTGEWEFRFKRTDRLTPHAAHPGKVAALQNVDATWASDLSTALDG